MILISRHYQILFLSFNRNDNDTITQMVYYTVIISYFHFVVLVLSGPQLLPEHCVLKHINEEVTLHPSHAAFISINNRQINRPVKLSQGELISDRYNDMQTCTLPSLGVTTFRDKNGMSGYSIKASR